MVKIQITGSRFLEVNRVGDHEVKDQDLLSMNQFLFHYVILVIVQTERKSGAKMVKKETWTRFENGATLAYI